MSIQSIATQGAGTPAEFEANRYCWPGQDRRGAAQLWEELSGWVDWLRERYELEQKQLPKCWYRHGMIVEELTALMAAWHQAYHYTPNPDELGPEGDVQAQFGSAMAYWHRTFLWPCLTEIEARSFEHREDRCYHGHPEPYPSDMKDTIAAMVEARPAGRPKLARIERSTGSDDDEIDDGTEPDDEAPRSRFFDPADMTEAIDDGDAEVLTGEGHPVFPDVRFEGLRWTYDADREDYRSVAEDEPPER
ncbi:hypothetical protein [Tsukamurella pulmonis]|uniref:hypothetical protein n=1 Tax=Tsukamurella pulmonis TaxID=47312 RepID=UPI000A8EC3F3|nr:hypothetical protein [Tsukamurella pulmonis]